MSERKNRVNHLFFGDRVVLTPGGTRAGLQGTARTPYGVVIAVEPPLRVLIVKHGQRGANTYHIDFWQKVDRFPWESSP